MRRFRQIPISELVRGFDWPVALLAERPEDFSRVLSLNFERSRDDLDDLEGAALVSDRGVVFCLRYYLNAPIKGTEVVINEATKDATFDLDEAIRVLEEIGPNIMWRHPGI